MKKKNGFTLIELLAVIVILAIIALIATPIILNLIEQSRKGAAKDSAYGLKKAAELYYSSHLLNDESSFNTITFTCDGTECISSEGHKLQISGTIPSSGSITINGQGEIYFGKQFVDDEFLDDYIYFGQYICIQKENKKIECSIEKVNNKHNPGIICGNGEEEDYEGNDVCYVSSVEDMNKLASMVNSGKTFEGKTVEVLNNINFKNANLDVIASSSTTPFAGTFEGNGYTLSNIKIEGNDNTAMFGYNSGTIRGINIDNITVTGAAGTAGVVSVNTGTISMINLTGTITGTSNVNGISAGRSVYVSTDTVKDVIVNANITATNGNAIGIATASYVLKGINEGGQITGSSKGYATYEGEASRVNIKTMSIVSDPARYTDSRDMNAQLPSNNYNNLKAYSDYVTTILGGADENGYYFDYNAAGTDIVVKNIKTKPINTELAGSGTAEDPYLIYNANDLKKVAITADTTGKYYSLMSDIDMTDEVYYVIGSSTKPFAGTFEGNGYTLSNIKIEGNDNTAMFGYNSGTIRGINIDNINVTGGSGTAGVVAVNDGGTISMINLSGTITGTSNVSGISAGRNVYNGADVIKDVIVNANITATNGNAIGIATSSYVLKGINEGGQISGSSRSYASYEGEASRWNIKTMSIATNPARYTDSRDMNAQLSSDNYNNLTAYSTYITTSADENGYYFDYNADGTDIIVKHV